MSIYRKEMAGAIYSDAQIAVARILTAARCRAGMKQTELAKLIGKHQSYISDIERGQRRVDVLELYVIANALGLSAIELYVTIIEALPDVVRV